MAETLGMLCDKLTIVKLKEYHTEDSVRLKSLASQSRQLQQEIDEYVKDAVAGKISVEKMGFSANKVFKIEGHEPAKLVGGIGSIFGQLADINCRLWHAQEKVYNFEAVLPAEKDKVVKQLATLNLERNQCIDTINDLFKQLILQ